MMYLYIERAHARKVILGVKSSVQLKLCIYNCTVYIVKCIYNCVTTVSPKIVQTEQSIVYISLTHRQLFFIYCILVRIVPTYVQLSRQ